MTTFNFALMTADQKSRFKSDISLHAGMIPLEFNLFNDGWSAHFASEIAAYKCALAYVGKMLSARVFKAADGSCWIASTKYW